MMDAGRFDRNALSLYRCPIGLLAQLRDIGTHLENSNPMQAWR